MVKGVMDAKWRPPFAPQDRGLALVSSRKLAKLIAWR